MANKEGKKEKKCFELETLMPRPIIIFYVFAFTGQSLPVLPHHLSKAESLITTTRWGKNKQTHTQPVDIIL